MARIKKMSSTDNVVRFDRPEPEPEPESAGFAQTRDAWLSRWHSDRRLTHSERVICSRMNQYFNREHFERTDGDLLAWPSWQTLMDETGMSKTSVYERLRNLERLGAFEVDHGRYDDKTKKRAGNRYLVRKSKVHSAEPCRGDQGSASRTNQGSASRTRLDESDSVIKKEGNSKNGNSRGPTAPEKDPQPLLSDSDLKPSPRSTYGVPATDGPARPLRLIVPGSEDMSLVKQYEAGRQRFWRRPDGSCLLTESEYAAVNGGGSMTAVSS
jgi:hypothetical protein